MFVVVDVDVVVVVVVVSLLKREWQSVTVH
jgi:hypothetical protein